MWISDFAIKKPVVTTVLVLALVVFGAISLLGLDTDEFPEVNPPVINVSIPYPGASTGTVERELVDPLEEAFSSISGLDKMSSTSTDGFASITIEFVFEKDLQEASQDIRDKISEARQQLPLEIEEPIVTRFDPNDLPIVSLTLTSDTRSPAELTRLADPPLTTVLRGITGVADVKVIGGIERELTVEARPFALAAANISLAEVIAALQTGNLAAPVGRLTDPLDERTLRLRGRPQNPKDFEPIVVSRRGGRLVHLGDVADVRDGTEEPRSVALFDGRPAVGIDVIKISGSSTTDVSTRLRGKIDEIRKTLPKDVKLEVVRDAGVRVERSVEDVEMSLIEGALLTVLVVFIFLKSWRSTVITGLALPVSVLASFIAVAAFGFTLNTMSLLGLSLAIGILIDDAIVVRENIVRHMQMGKDHVRAAREGTSEIGLAVAATTFSIVVVFVPIAFMGGVAEQWFAPFALTIACSVLVSLFVSFSLDPMLSAVWADPDIERGGERKRNWLGRQLDRFEHWFTRQEKGYERVVAWALRHRLAMVLIAIGSFVLALAMPATGLLGSSFVPLQDLSEFTIHLETPPGSSLGYTRLKALEATRIARRHKEVAFTYATVGGTGQVVDEARIYVRLVPKAERTLTQQDLESLIRGEARRLAGVTTSLETGGFRREKQIQLQLTGSDLRVLGDLADRVAAEVKQVPGAVDVGLSTRGKRPELNVTVDRTLAGSLGITVGAIAQALRAAFAGIDVGDWVDPSGETRDVWVRLTPETRTRPEDLRILPLLVPAAPGTAPTATPQTVPLGQLVQITREVGPSQIEHLDRKRVVVIGANTEGAPLSAVVGAMTRRIAAVGLPPGYTITQGGETERQNEVFGRILLALGVAVLLMYLILVIQFGSFLDPLAIMASLPLSLVGVMLALLVTGSTLNLMSMIGVILLMGIVAKNAILLIDFAKWSQARGVPRAQALIEAGGVRLRPILMTSFAIIAGMVPVAMARGEGADFRAPLGRAVIGGVITSTVLTLLVIPTFYDILAGAREWVVGRLRRPQAAPSTPPL